MSWWEGQIPKSIGSFSESEVDTKQQWIDGKTIYRKVVDCGTLPNATTKTVSHGISGIDWVVRVWGTAKATSWIPLPWVDKDSSGQCLEVIVDSGDIRLITSNNYSGYTSSYVTIEYTKT